MFDSHTLDFWEQWVSPGSAAPSSSPANSLSQSDWDSFLSSEVPIYDNLLYLSDPNISDPIFNSNTIQDHLNPYALVPSNPVPSDPSPNSIDINPDEHSENPLMIQPDSSTITLADLTAASFLTRGSTNGALWTVSANHETVSPQPISRPAPEPINDEPASQNRLEDHAPGLNSQYASTLSSQSPATASIIASPATETKTASAKPGRKRAAGDEPDEDRADKRRRNTIAAAKYRQKKLDRISELEESLDTVTKERDDLKLELARRDAEFALLKKLLMERDPYRGN